MWGLSMIHQRVFKDFKTNDQTPRKDTTFHFNDDCLRSFQLLKERLIGAPIMRSPNWNLQFELMSDASDRAVGAVLGQTHD